MTYVGTLRKHTIVSMSLLELGAFWLLLMINLRSNLYCLFWQLAVLLYR